MKEIIVSIFCLAYNHESYIQQCLEGFIMQKTNFAFEAIIHDDASTDNTAKIIHKYAEKYPNIIKPIYESENLYSKHDNRIYDIIKAHLKGKYVALCEGDDYWTDPFKLQKQVNFLEKHTDYGLVYTNVDFYFQNENRYEKQYLTSGKKPHSKNFIEHLRNAGYIAPCTWLIKKEYVFLPQYEKYVDGTYPLALDIWANSKIHFLNESTAVYRILNESMSHSKSLRKKYKFRLGVFNIQKDYINKYKQLIHPEIANEIIAKKYYSLSYPAIALNDYNFLKKAELFFRSKGNYIQYFLIKSRSCLISKIIIRFIYRKKGYYID